MLQVQKCLEELSDEWSYPKSFLASDGNIFGISYNKLWVLTKWKWVYQKGGELELKLVEEYDI